MYSSIDQPTGTFLCRPSEAKSSFESAFVFGMPEEVALAYTGTDGWDNERRCREEDEMPMLG